MHYYGETRIYTDSRTNIQQQIFFFNSPTEDTCLHEGEAFDMSCFHLFFSFLFYWIFGSFGVGFFLCFILTVNYRKKWPPENEWSVWICGRGEHLVHTCICCFFLLLFLGIYMWLLEAGIANTRHANDYSFFTLISCNSL